jgi:hypothetical protein
MPTKTTTPRRQRLGAKNIDISTANSDKSQIIVANSDIPLQNSDVELFLSEVSLSEIHDYLEQEIWTPPDHDAELSAALDKWLSHKQVAPESSERARAWLRSFMTAVESNQPLPSLAPIVTKPTLPAEAPYLYAQRDTYKDRPELKGLNIVDFIRAVWKDPWIDAGVLTRPDLRRLDLDAYKALNTWLQRHNGDLPPDLDLPKKGEALFATAKKIAAAADMDEDALRRFGVSLAKRMPRMQP